MYSAYQKDLLVLLSDLLPDPLSTEEKDEIRNALLEQGKKTSDSLQVLQSTTRKKAENRLSQGFKLAYELEKLDQRGIAVIFSDEIPKRIAQCFAAQPDVLFLVGDTSKLSTNDSMLSFTATSFVAHNCEGILFADRPLESLLHDSAISSGLRRSHSLIISDHLRSRARLEQFSSKEICDITSRQQAKAVFVSGSRSQVEIPKSVQTALDAIVAQDFRILIGDSDRGVDNEIIDYLRAPLYDRVALYTIKASPRVIPEPEWEVARIQTDESLPAQKQQMSKDRAMATVATFGLAIFKPIEKNRRGNLQVSSGTLRNTIQMLIMNKKVKFFYLFENEMHMRNLAALEELEEVLQEYANERISPEEERMIRSAKGVNFEEAVSQAKSKRIWVKYQELLKSERKALASDTERQSSDVNSKPVQTTLPLFD